MTKGENFIYKRRIDPNKKLFSSQTYLEVNLKFNMSVPSSSVQQLELSVQDLATTHSHLLNLIEHPIEQKYKKSS